ncbi:radical SAM family heme chaperone HemW [Candidatus Electronema sp. PJ]|uniref:radical SAM family heme chaperone HemW n=1 Tax=Candidatus Electronema sp. PJ TaxID=3401572 RepID=UPI003AA9995F
MQQDLGLYLHVPFCLRKCAYCSFYSEAGLPVDQGQAYLAAVSKQLRWFAQFFLQQPLTSIFFGGGTPTLLPAKALQGLLADCLHSFPALEEAEISIEVNPATVDLSALQTLRQAGFNRLSIGVQSLQDKELQRLGRPHSAQDAVQTVQLARQAGFTNLNLDLMYGLPGQTLRSWQETLAQALALQPQHLSLYELTIEKGTPFARQQAQGALLLPDEETGLQMLVATQLMLSSADFHRYEISNYALPGFACRHNLNYWRNGEYFGLGPGAVSCLQGKRRSAVADWREFCRLMEDGQQVWQEEEHLENEAAFRETVVMGLRMLDGVSLPELRRRFGLDAQVYYGETLLRLMQQGLLEIVQEKLRLTAQGLLLANTVMAELV